MLFTYVVEHRCLDYANLMVLVKSSQFFQAKKIGEGKFNDEYE